MSTTAVFHGRGQTRALCKCSKQQYTNGMDKNRLAGAAGIEPANADTKNRCLTTWPRPIRGRSYTDCCNQSIWFGYDCVLDKKIVCHIYRKQVFWLRSIAQSGSVPCSERGGRRFKSCYSDQNQKSCKKLNSHKKGRSC